MDAVAAPPPLGALEVALINRFQGGFPLTARPFAAVAEHLGGTEAALIATLGGLLAGGRLSRFGPLYNAERLGGGLLLAAMEVPEPDFDRVAALVNAFPEVAHNYRREHRLNLWPVLATATPGGIEEVARRIEAATGLPLYRFPKEREFYLGLWLEVDAAGARGTRSIPEPAADPAYRPDALDLRICRATQAGLPLVPEPYAAVAAQLGCGEAQVIGRLAAMLAAGAVRRIGLVPNHYRLGLRGNGMTVWDLPDGRLEELGTRIGALDWVSHCYVRPRHPPHWPYNLFAMVHGRDRAEVDAKVTRMAALLAGDSRGHQVLLSSAVLKKTGLRIGD